MQSTPLVGVVEISYAVTNCSHVEVKGENLLDRQFSVRFLCLPTPV